MPLVLIDFVPGSHGNFLEFACNKFIAHSTSEVSPFLPNGSSHRKTEEYNNNKVFHAFHSTSHNISLSEKIIRITFTPEDLLLLSSISILRAGDMNIDNDDLEHLTYFKLNNQFYKNLISHINDAYPEAMLSESNPNCARHILREFFKFGFKDPSSHGLTKLLDRMKYNSSHNVFDFSFQSFYNSKLFLDNFIKLSQWLHEDVNDINQKELLELHNEFLSKQIYKSHKEQADDIITAIKNKQQKSIPRLTLFQESYINGSLENLYGKEMPFLQEQYFNNTSSILRHLNV